MNGGAEGMHSQEIQEQRWRELEARGLPRTAIAAATGTTRHKIREALGPRAKSAPNRREQHNIRVDPDLFDRASEVARSMGLTISGGVASGEGSVGQLIELIGAGHLVVKIRKKGDDAKRRD